MARDIRGKFYSPKRTVWGGSKKRRAICPICRVRPCLPPRDPKLRFRIVEYTDPLKLECVHCICWDRAKHCCWCEKERGKR